MKPILSAIMPIYKVEDYLKRGIDSILGQNYESMELILVDDGSPDKCPEICDEYAKSNPQVKVVHKPNGGLSSARNAGIKVASGEYIIFMDSDDQWIDGKLKPLMEQLLANDMDMTFFGTLGLHSNGSIMQKKDGQFFCANYRKIKVKDLYPIMISEGDLHEGASALALKKEFIIRNNLWFKDRIIGEDTEWMFRALRCTDEVAISNIRLYLYTVGRPGSITKTGSTKSVIDTLSTIQSSIDFYKQFPNHPLKIWELSHCAYLWTIALGIYSHIPASDKKELKPILKNTIKHLDMNSHPKARMVSKFYNIIGFELTAKLLQLYMTLHSLNLVNKKTKI